MFSYEKHIFVTAAGQGSVRSHASLREGLPVGAEEWERQTPICSSFQAFAAELLKVFGCESFRDAAAGELLTLQQGHPTFTSPG